MHLPTHASEVEFPPSRSGCFLWYPGGHSGTQLIPSPANWYPFEQTQRKEPGAFTQASAHGPRPVFSIHSSISVQSDQKTHITQEPVLLDISVKLGTWFKSRLTFTVSICDIHAIPHRTETAKASRCVDATKHTASQASRQHTLVHIWE